MLIVGLTEGEPPEAESGDDETKNTTIQSIIHVDQVATTTMAATTIPITTIASKIATTTTAETTTKTNKNLFFPNITTTEVPFFTTSLIPGASIPALDLRNLPTLFNLLKQLTVIPNLVRSFSGNSGSTTTLNSSNSFFFLNLKCNFRPNNFFSC